MTNILNPISRHLNQDALILRCGSDLPPIGTGYGHPITTNGFTDTFTINRTFPEGEGAYLWYNGKASDYHIPNEDILTLANPWQGVTKRVRYEKDLAGDAEGIYISLDLYTRQTPSDDFIVTVGDHVLEMNNIYISEIGDYEQLVDDSGAIYRNTNDGFDGGGHLQRKNTIEVFVPDAVAPEGDFDFSIRKAGFAVGDWGIDNVYMVAGSAPDGFFEHSSSPANYIAAVIQARVDYVPAVEDLAGSWNETIAKISSLSKQLEIVGVYINRTQSLDSVDNKNLKDMADRTVETFNSWSNLEGWSSALVRSLQGEYVVKTDFLNSMLTAAKGWGLFSAAVTGDAAGVFASAVLLAKDTMEEVATQNNLQFPGSFQFSAVDTFDFIHEELEERGLRSRADALEASVNLALDEFGDLAANMQATELVSTLFDRAFSYNSVKFYDYDLFEDLGFNVTTRSDGWQNNRTARVKDIEVKISDGARDLAYDISYNIRLREPTLGEDTYILSDLALA